jgi:hypothetical protein
MDYHPPSHSFKLHVSSFFVKASDLLSTLRLKFPHIFFALVKEIKKGNWQTGIWIVVSSANIVDFTTNNVHYHVVPERDALQDFDPETPDQSNISTNTPSMSTASSSLTPIDTNLLRSKNSTSSSTRFTEKVSTNTAAVSSTDGSLALPDSAVQPLSLKIFKKDG